ncbi:MAG: 1-deoxy-D-xylulose-5-phosphate reductoisomerase [Candidatus Tectomicrobia bacterium]|uniref:1-deoxy-D-xylulose 5-phosphate reductoisomerase n=1 Tax=Tectimicrobiota bacterium TaxID=2528274 RepID=A0A932M2M9_UNCTE|nr:1-deoxy-D-xylulose-5-phosphate reductoisomerase [Candidatus Tectomicrobia bacterium]
MKRIAILGSTGSVGISTLDIVARSPDRFQVVGLTANTNVDLLESQARCFHPKIVAVRESSAAREMRRRLDGSGCEVGEGVEGLIRVATRPDVDLVVSAMVGGIGLLPTYAALQAGIDVALANKEVLVIAGELMTREARGKARIIPIDSEHSAIFQCLNGEHSGTVRRLILTASGGPFWNLQTESFETITPAEALKHPNWEMGKKITIDSATLMNKGLEVIEAHWLFGLEIEKIHVLIHPQSVVHSMVEFVDGSVMAQMGIPDMRIPISYALSYPDRLPNDLPPLDLVQIGRLEFYSPDTEKFPCLAQAFEALRQGGTMPAVLNGANEVAVEAFLQERIGFTDIPRLVEGTMAQHRIIRSPSLNDLLEADAWVRREGARWVKRLAHC